MDAPLKPASGRRGGIARGRQRGGGKEREKAYGLEIEEGNEGAAHAYGHSACGALVGSAPGGRVPPVKLLFSCLYFGLCK